MPDPSVRIDEVTRLHPVTMARVVTPRTIQDIVNAVKATPGPISIGGGRYSMGGQTATPDGIQLDMRQFRGVVSLDTAARTITVRSGTRWREVQEALDRVGLAVKIMQTYNTFTVGGALSVNAHGRYIGQGPLVRSVRDAHPRARGRQRRHRQPDGPARAVLRRGGRLRRARRHRARDARRRRELARAARRREAPRGVLPRVLPEERAG